MPDQRDAAAVIADWRTVERDLEAAQDGTVEAERLTADSVRLRYEYQRLIETAWEDNRPAPPPFPTEVEVEVESFRHTSGTIPAPRPTNGRPVPPLVGDPARRDGRGPRGGGT